ncbi:MAG: serine-type D-Ala-D-Ala carboxypeptidase, partial [Marinobacter sp.]
GTSSSAARAQEVQKMLNYGFRYYETERLFRAGQELMAADVWGGVADEVSVGMAEDVYVTIPRGSRDKLESTVDLDSVIKAPIKMGQELGQVRVLLDGETVVEQPVLALTEIEQGGLFKRLWDSIKLFFIQLFN